MNLISKGGRKEEKMTTVRQARKMLIPMWLGVAPVGPNDAKRVLMKFFVTNPAHIPPGFPKKTPKHHKKQEPGKCAISNLPHTSVARLKRGLARAGYVLVDGHYFQLGNGSGSSKPPKNVICLTFSRQADRHRSPKLTPADRQVIAGLFKTSWNYVHVNVNPNGLTTVEMLGRIPDSAPKQALIVHQYQIQAIHLNDLK